MTKEVLEEYSSLVKEIEDIRERIKKEERKKETVYHDVVTGSAASFPYTKQRIHIEGYNINEYSANKRKIARYKKLMEDFCVEAEKKKISVEEYIQSLNDSRMRRILRYRYLDGYSWPKVANMMGGDHTEEGCRKAFVRFMKKEK